MSTTNESTLANGAGKETAKPNGASKTAVIKKPAAAKKPVAVKKPVAAKKAVAVKKAVVARKPLAAKKAVLNKPVAEKKTVAKAVKSVKTKAAPKVVIKEVAAPKEKHKKAKLVRDSFSMPEAEYAILGAVKKACLKAGVEVKKSELLRIGVALIQKLDVAALKGVLSTLPPLKAGRPKQDK
jgi:hypothetical protein